MTVRRPLLTLKNKTITAVPSAAVEPLVITTEERTVVVKPTRRQSRHIVWVVGATEPPRKIHGSLERARKEAGRLVASGAAEHAFIAHIIESAKVTK